MGTFIPEMFMKKISRSFEKFYFENSQNIFWRFHQVFQSKKNIWDSYDFYNRNFEKKSRFFATFFRKHFRSKFFNIFRWFFSNHIYSSRRIRKTRFHSIPSDLKNLFRHVSNLIYFFGLKDQKYIRCSCVVESMPQKSVSPNSLNITH